MMPGRVPFKPAADRRGKQRERGKKKCPSTLFRVARKIPGLRSQDYSHHPRLLGAENFSAAFACQKASVAIGATAGVLSGVDGLPCSINIRRAGLVSLGGVGVTVLLVAILPILGWAAERRDRMPASSV